MTGGDWDSQEQRHGRHRDGAIGAAWTPAVRPTDTGPVHAWRDRAPAHRPTDTAPSAGWPAGEALKPGPEWPVDPGPEPEVPSARTTADAPAWPASRGPAHTPADGAPPSFPREPAGNAAGNGVGTAAGQDVSSDPLADTVPMAGAKHSMPEVDPLSSAVVYALPESPATGLRTFDLGTVPASVTPPSSWRKAAWFAVGTSAAVVLGLAVATAELMGRPVDDGELIDALPAYPSWPLTQPQLPHGTTTPDAPEDNTGRPTTTRRQPSTNAATPPPSRHRPPPHTVTGSATGEMSVVPTEKPTEKPTTTSQTTSSTPTRETVGPALITLTDPDEMGDVTEQYFLLVTTDPAAAHAMTTGDMAHEGAAGIEARYGTVRRVEVQDITIDRNRAITTSRVKVVHEDGTETVERRRLTFTWGNDPKILDDTVTA